MLYLKFENKKWPCPAYGRKVCSVAKRYKVSKSAVTKHCLVPNWWVDDHLVTTVGSIGCHLVTTWTVIAWWPLWDQFGIPWWPLCDYFIKYKHLSNQKTYCASNHDHFKTILQCTTKWTFTFTAARLIERWLQIDTSFSIWFGMRDMSKKSRGVVGRGLGRP